MVVEIRPEDVAPLLLPQRGGKEASSRVGLEGVFLQEELERQRAEIEAERAKLEAEKEKAAKEAEKKAQKEAEKKAREEEKAKAAAQKKKDRVKAKIETQVVSTAGQLLRKGLFGILSRK